MKNKFLITFICIFLVPFYCWSQTTFTNPLLPSGADPWSIYKDGYYYYTHTFGDRLVIWKTKNIADLKSAPHKTVFIPPAGKEYSKQLWAPELHFIYNKWYLYFAADSGRNEGHRLWVLENSAKDPMQGTWILKGRVTDPGDKWAIDGSVFKHKGVLYMVWSGWEGDTNGEQDIYISKMKNPWTLKGKRVRLSSPILQWEQHGDLHDANNPPHVNVNEGPQFLQHGNRIFLIYSASGCWTEYYALGMLSTTANSNLLDSAAWKKNPEPVFKASVENGVYAPGHNSFFKSPDGREDWILYHANSESGQGCGRKRSPRAQKFTWDNNGIPYFGEPAKPGVEINIPSEKNLRSKNKRYIK
ncbi:MAG TPA: glycoside hydrolase family 43 protein [Chitinophagaceae bacterium]|nr:glycoside hydrolase family 43 protein [Chitinophagaceae bacterium]